MKRYADALAADAKFAAALPAGRAGATFGSCVGSAAALAIAAAAKLRRGVVLAVVADPEDAEHLVADLELAGAAPLLFPTRGAQADRLRLRLDAADAARAGGDALLVAPLLAILEPLPNERAVRESIQSVAVGEIVKLPEVVRRLVNAGYERVPLVAKPGELSLRGDLLDFWPFAVDAPLRVEAFDDRVESIRRFDAATQRSIERLERVAVPLVRDDGASGERAGVDPMLAFPADALIVTVEPARVDERGDGLSLQGESIRERYRRFAGEREARAHLALRTLPGGDLDLGSRSVRELGVGMRATHDVLPVVARDNDVVVFCATDAEGKRLREILKDRGVDPKLPIDVRVGDLGRGFTLPRVKLCALTHAELIGATAIRRPLRAKRALATRAIAEANELTKGDLVVHAVHGVGRFQGMKRVEKGGGEEDHLAILYADESTLFVPASRIDLVSKYIGAGQSTPALDKIGSGAFSRRKAQVRAAVADMAADLLEVHAMREARTGFACPSDDELQREFEAEFPWQDTEDQVSVTAELKRDLESPKPMDRLLCGDVGYGKTELAMRAAAKVVRAGRQAAVLVPTTVLAQQHLQTFRERFADFPVTVDMVSRFRTDREIRDVLRRAGEGSLDILIGTHRLLSKDVQFRDLGLVIVDEEQRFGVKAKEQLKRLRASVDVLSMTATPIPRTLHQALVGLRDISALTTPPPGREAIETHVGECEDEELLQRTLRFELNRGGQAFFVHNRIATLQRRAEELAKLVPEGRYGVAHGQMDDDELEEAMTAFVRGEFDVLVSTAIVESGLDIPRANTIFLDHAEMFGLADLHQLRGRVGRGAHKAYCYLLLPKHGALGEDARARVRAIEEMQQLGAGFNIAMKDLEIRGAGNLLGSEQSGHIAAVGYDLYCRLLRATVERLTQERLTRKGRESAAAKRLGIPAPKPLEREAVKTLGDELDAGADGRGIPSPKAVLAIPDEERGVDMELGVRAYLPESYVPDPRMRMEVYRLMDGVGDRKRYDAVAADLRDRFGRIPPEVARLLDLFLVKNRLKPSTARLVVYARDRYIVDFEDRAKLDAALAEGFRDRRYVDASRAHVVFDRERELTPDRALERLVAALDPLAPRTAGGVARAASSRR